MREALSEYRKILKKWPTNMDAIKFLVVCLNALNMTDEAVQWTQKYDKLKGVGA